MADDAPSPLAHARFLPNGGDRFLGFWLGLSVEGRAGGISSGERGARRIIDAFLREHGAVGLPLYVVYPSDGSAPKVLPALLTPSVARDALIAASNKG